MKFTKIGPWVRKPGLIPDNEKIIVEVRLQLAADTQTKQSNKSFKLNA